jgi:hypothetical protein
MSSEEGQKKMPYKALYGKLHHWVTHPKEYNFEEAQFDAIQQYSKKLLDILNGNIDVSVPQSRPNVVIKDRERGRNTRRR